MSGYPIGQSLDPTFNYDRAGVCKDANTTYDTQSESQRQFQDAVFGDLGQCKPTGYFEVFIDDQDAINKTQNGQIDGVDTTMPNLKGIVNADGEQANGEKAQKFRAFVDLDWDSENFGVIDEKFGFAHNITFAGTIWQKWFSWGTYNNADNDKYQFKSLYDHPNTRTSLTLQMMNLKKWADFHGLSHDEVENRLRKNNEFLANTYKKIVDSGEDLSEYVESGVINTKTAIESGKLDGSSTDTSKVDEILKDAKNGEMTAPTGGIGNVEQVLEVFSAAPKEFATAFGLKEQQLVSLKYPHDAVYGQSEIGGQDHMVIEQFSYKAPQNLFLGPTEGADARADFFTGLRRNRNIEEYVGIVKMPIPNNLSYTNGVSWGDSKLNSIEAAAFFNTFSSTAGLVGDGNFGKLFDDMGSDLGAIVQKIANKGLAKDTPANLALSSFISQFALGRVGINVDGNAALTRGTGAAINPNLELLFNGPKLRNFQFAFNFAPNDELDASIMRRIQKFFKLGMSPVRNQANLLFLGSPNVFRLRYRTKEQERIKGLPMHKICALTSCEINYTPDNVYQAYEDEAAGSSPVRTIMNLSFTELTPIFQDDYLGGDESMSDYDLRGRPPEDDLFNDIYDGVDGSTGMEIIEQEDTGF